MFYFPLVFFSNRSEIQTHSRCCDHITQLDTFKPTPALEFFFLFHICTANTASYVHMLK